MTDASSSPETTAPSGAPSLATSRATIVDAPSTAERLVLAAVYLLVAILVMGVAYVAATGILSGDAPRSEAERRLVTMEAAILETPGDEAVHAEYASALISTGQYSLAAQVVERALEILPGSPPILLESARLSYATGDVTAASATLDDVFAATEVARAAFEADLAERGITGTFSLPHADTLITAALLSARIHEEAAEWQAVADAYTLALAEDETMADVLVSRGEAYLTLGMTEEARADFESALLYVPDFERAEQGLASLEASSS